MSKKQGKQTNHRNQYSEYETTEEAAKRLESMCISKPNDFGMFTCEVPDCKNFTGFETRKSGYIRMNRNGKKIFCHVLAHSVHPWYNSKLDVSHLCGNPKCCSKHHLWSETHKVNLSRKGCPGDTFLLEGADTRHWYVLCNQESFIK